ncbi:hypothetical protein Sjap_003723 [Stephania japonica]|uniref:Malic enzyme N-terminal domain-containing protein n=1 Tax=Stephania japonica TaxID=461633 RepID=A0AAP0KQX4_9MAGN
MVAKTCLSGKPIDRRRRYYLRISYKDDILEAHIRADRIELMILPFKAVMDVARSQEVCLPITLDVGTNNEKLLNGEFTLTSSIKRATSKEYAFFLHEFMGAVKHKYGKKVIIQFENFANHNAFELISMERVRYYNNRHCNWRGCAKNQVLQDAGAVVPTSYEAFEDAIKETFEKLVLFDDILIWEEWRKMPPLTAPRYAPATQLWRGRLHVMGGSKEDRYEPALEHWSIAVKDGRVLENDWRAEIPIPRGGPHRACIVVDDRLFVIGGQEGDFMAKPGSPIFKCSRRHEVVYGDVYMLDDEMKWKVLPPMPEPDSHIEFAWAVINNYIIIVGGTTEKHPVTKKMILVGEVFHFHLDTLKWLISHTHNIVWLDRTVWGNYRDQLNNRREENDVHYRPPRISFDWFWVLAIS